MAKHGWNSFENYIGVHEKTLRFYEKYMESVRTYSHSNDTEFDYKLRCEGIFFHTYHGTRIRVDLAKDLEIDPTNPKRRRARVERYTYSANLPGRGPLIRYCSPHDRWELEGSAPHHRFHHKHDFTSGQEVITKTGDNWPHVGEFLEEVLKSF